MHKLQNETLQNFLDNLIDELKRENEDNDCYERLDIPFIISTLYQSFKNSTEKYNEFISDLEKYSDYVIQIEKSANDYNGIVDVLVSLINHSEFAGYSYKFDFSYDERNWGYCYCTPTMSDYRTDKHCCGHTCDANFCQFEMYKILHITTDTWHGDEHDYWDFEDEFYASDKELADKKAEEDKTRMIKSLKETIEEATKKLAELESK